MEIAYKERPTEEEIKNYKEKLEHYLQYQDIKIEVVLRETPIEMWSKLNGEETEHKFSWLRGLNITNQENNVNNLFIHLHGYGNVTNNEPTIWNDAFIIQNAYYRHLNKIPTLPKEGDEYWELWNLRK